MSAPKILISVVVATSMSILACAKPPANQTTEQIITTEVPQNATPNERTLDEVLNNTVCRIRVENEVKEGRVPRTIQMIKCAAQPSHCSRSDSPSVDCCNYDNPDSFTSCMEITDSVLVFYEADGQYHRNDVSVGCSCVVQNKILVTTVVNSLSRPPQHTS